MPRLLPFLALLIAAVVLRFHDLPGRVMHTDEAVHAVTTGRLLAGEAFKYDPRDFHGPTLHYSTIPVAVARGQSSFGTLDEATLRGVTAGYGVLLVALTFAFRRELGNAASWIAAWLAAISPMLVFFSRYYIMEIPFAVFLALFALCAWRWHLAGEIVGTVAAPADTDTLTPEIAPTDHPSSGRSKTVPVLSGHARGSVSATAWGRRPDVRWIWLLGAGVCLGLLHATKETFVIHIAAMAAAVALAGGGASLRATLPFCRAHWRELAATLLLGFTVSAALLSHGFQRPEAITDGLRTYLLYFDRAEGQSSGHAQPWYFYFASLFFLKPSGGFFYSEIAMLGLGAIGAVRAFVWPVGDPSAARFHRILAMYAVFTAAAYSVIPYKTPWSFLATMHALVLLSGLALAAMIPVRSGRGKTVPRMPGRNGDGEPEARPGRSCYAKEPESGTPATRSRRQLALAALGCLLLALASTHALLYDSRIIVNAPAAPEQPMIYGHTCQEFLDLVREIDRLQETEGRPLELAVAEEENGWPMPWYRRASLGHNRYGKSLPDLAKAPDILCVSHDWFPDAAQALASTHISRGYALRPGVPLRVFFRESLAGQRPAGPPVLRPARP